MQIVRNYQLTNIECNGCNSRESKNSVQLLIGNQKDGGSKMGGGGKKSRKQRKEQRRKERRTTKEKERRKKKKRKKGSHGKVKVRDLKVLNRAIAKKGKKKSCLM